MVTHVRVYLNTLRTFSSEIHSRFLRISSSVQSYTSQPNNCFAIPSQSMDVS